MKSTSDSRKQVSKKWIGIVSITCLIGLQLFGIFATGLTEIDAAILSHVLFSIALLPGALQLIAQFDPSVLRYTKGALIGFIVGMWLYVIFFTIPYLWLYPSLPAILIVHSDSKGPIPYHKLVVANVLIWSVVGYLIHGMGSILRYSKKPGYANTAY